MIESKQGRIGLIYLKWLGKAFLEKGHLINEWTRDRIQPAWPDLGRQWAEVTWEWWQAQWPRGLAGRDREHNFY